jgi:hypothetical protein
MHFDATSSLAEIGLRPRPIEESLGDAVSWLRQAGYLRESAASGRPRRSVPAVPEKTMRNGPGSGVLDSESL